MINIKYNINNNDIKLIIMKSTILIKIYNKPVNIIIIIIALYLLFTIITVFKIIELNKGPLRIIFN